MNPYPTDWTNLENEHDRVIASLAYRATNDTIFGSSQTMVAARRMEKEGTNLDPCPTEIVGDVYSRSTDRTSETFGAWACSECGQAYLGRDAAALCCQEDEE